MEHEFDYSGYHVKISCTSKDQIKWSGAATIWNTVDTGEDVFSTSFVPPKASAEECQENAIRLSKTVIDQRIQDGKWLTN